jgi:aspartate carbamoyltransferase catalytic subunit
MAEKQPVQRQWVRKDLIGLEDLTRDELEMILETAPQFLAVSQRESGIKKVPLLQGRLVVNWFFEPSTRTRTSFELAAKRLSADTLTMNVNVSSAKKGETLHDTLYNIEAMHSDIVVLRHGMAGSSQLLAKSHPSGIINAGDGAHEHPTQALLDAFTMLQHIRCARGDESATLDGVRVAIIGDIAHSRVARSNVWCLKKLGASVVVCGPRTLIPPHIGRMGCDVTSDLSEAIEGADVVYSLRIQLERQQKCLFPSLREYVRLFRIDSHSLQAAPAHAIVMHPGPINRDVELSSEVADGPRNVILDQVTNGVAVRMAVMHLLVNKPVFQN